MKKGKWDKSLSLKKKKEFHSRSPSFSAMIKGKDEVWKINGKSQCEKITLMLSKDSLGECHSAEA